MSRMRVLLILTAIGACTAIVALIPIVRDHVIESRLIADLEREDWRRAADVLAERGSARAIPPLLERVSSSTGLVDRTECMPDFDDSGADAALRNLLDRNPRGGARALAALLASPDARIAERAAGWLRGFGKLIVGYEGVVRREIEDADGCRRVHLAALLWEMGADVDGIAVLMADCLRRGVCTEDAAALLIHLGPTASAATPALVRLAAEHWRNGKAHLEAESVLILIGGASTELLGALLQSESAAVRSGAVELLGQIGGNDALTKVVSTLSDSSVNVRDSALRALEGFDRVPRSAVPVLCSILQDTSSSDPPAIRAALAALGTIGDVPETCVRTVLQLARHEGSVRNAAIATLGKIRWRGQGAEADLVAWSRDADESVRVSAIKAMCFQEARNASWQQRLSEASQTGSDLERLWAHAALLRCVGDEERRSATEIRNLLGSHPEEIVSVADFLGPHAAILCDLVVADAMERGQFLPVSLARSLGATRDCLAPAAIQGIREGDELTSCLVLQLLIRLGEAGKVIVEDLMELLHANEAAVRELAIRCLMMIGPDAVGRAEPALREIVESDVRHVRYTAWFALWWAKSTGVSVRPKGRS